MLGVRKATVPCSCSLLYETTLIICMLLDCILYKLKEIPGTFMSFYNLIYLV